MGNNKKILAYAGNIFTLLESAFRSMSCLISKPVFMETPDKLIVNLFYYLVPGKMASPAKRLKKSSVPLCTSLNGIEIPNTASASLTRAAKGGSTSLNKGTALAHRNVVQNLLTPKNIDKLNKLCTILSRIFKKPIELDLIRLHLPYFDDNILVRAIGIMSKKVHVRNIIKYIFSRTIIHSPKGGVAGVNSLTNKGSILPSFLAGIKIRIGGRLMTQRVIPRLSTRIIQRGAIARGKVNYVD